MNQPRRTSPWVPLLLVTGLGLAACAGFCGLLGLGGFMGVAAREERPPDPEDRVAMLSAADVLALVGETADPALETATRETRWDGSVELSWSYTDHARPFFLQGSINLENDSTDATLVYQGARIGVSIGGGGDLVLDPVPGGVGWGDVAELHVLRAADGTPVGNQFVGRKGSRVYWVLWSGAWTDDPALLAEMLVPRLEAMERLVR